MTISSARTPLVAALVLAGGVLRAEETAASNAVPPAVPILRVISNFQTYDPFLPWQKSPPGARAGYAFLNTDGMLVTTEDLVRNSTMIELQRPAGGEKYAATVELADEDINLAVLRVRDRDAVRDLTGMDCASGISPDARISIVQFDDTGRIQQGNAQMIEISFGELPSAKGACLVFKALTDLNMNGSGAVAVLGDKVVGLVMAYDRGTRIATLIPYTAISRFTAFSKEKEYRGFAAAGFAWTPLLDPAERKYLGVKDDGKGIVVNSVIPHTGAAGALQSGDVIVQWDGADLDNLGYYRDAEFGRLLFPHLIKGKRKPGETVTARLIRDKAAVEVSVPLARRVDAEALIPENTRGRQAPYIVEGGLVLRELTADYLRAYGSGWSTSADSRLVNAYVTRSQRPERVGDRIVILAQVLPDPVNVGYEYYRDEVVVEVNGQPIRNLDDVFNILDKESRIKTLKMQGIPLEIALDPAELDAANSRIAANYQIPALRRRDTGR